jgi:hypothetical protein
MPETPISPTFMERDDGLFVLQQEGADGTVAEIKLTEAQLQGLKATIDLWPDRKMSSFQVGSASPRKVICHPVDGVGVWPDAVQENVLLSIRTLSAETTFELPKSQGETLALALQHVLARMGPVSTRQ